MILLLLPPEQFSSYKNSCELSVESFETYVYYCFIVQHDSYVKTCKERNFYASVLIIIHTAGETFAK